MGYRVRRARWLGFAFAILVLTGCTPINDIFGWKETTAELPVIPDESPAPKPDPTPKPDPAPDPDPASGLTVVVDATNLIIPEGETGALAVRLSKQPDADVEVTVSIVITDGSIDLVDPAPLTFTTENWDRPQSLRFLAKQDENANDGTAIVELTLAGAEAVRVAVVASDDEVPQGDGVRLTVKDASTYGSVNSPVLAVIPVDYGKYQATENMRIRDADGNVVPSQITVLNRWWGRDNSIRHVVAQFQASVAPKGETTFFFRADGGERVLPANAVSVTEATNTVTVDTGKVRFKILKNGFNLFDEVYYDADGDGTYSDSERVVAPGSEGPVFTGRLDGDIQRSSERSNIKVVIEEEGPMRAVLRVSSLGKFTSTTDHDHGFAIRIYAYAGRSFVKVDYQLQNSAKNVRFSWPLYFEDVSLVMRTTLSNPQVRFALKEGEVWQGSVGSNGKHLLQSSGTSAVVRDSGNSSQLASASVGSGEATFGWADLADSRLGVAVMIRNMAEMWPNGIEALPGSEIAVRLWPKWSAQRDGSGTSSSGLYWLDDMQHVVKEVLFYFHGASISDKDLDAAAVNFQYYPVTFVPLSEYARTRVSLDLDGFIPVSVASGGADTYRVTETKSAKLDPGNERYAFGWADFGGNTSRKKSSRTGGYAPSGTHQLVSGRTDDFFAAERRMWGDLNVRPIWIAEYDHEKDFALLEPSENPYGGKSWRAFDGHSKPYLAASYLSGTSWGGWYPRDNAHAWFYHVEDYYNSSANPWVRDWYQWIGEFRKRTLFRTGEDGDPYFEWGSATRAEGHMFANALQAYRVVGGEKLLAGLMNRVRFLRDKRVSLRYGTHDDEAESAFQLGYLARSVFGLLREYEGYHPQAEAEAFLLLWGFMDWHYNESRYAYYISPGETRGSSGTGLTMVDPSALWYLRTGQAFHRTLMLDYVDGGVNGGKDPYSDFGPWSGAWEGRLYNYVKQQTKVNETPAAPITDLSASYSGGKVRIEWTAPAKAARYVVVWSTLPISRTYMTEADKRNPWGCNAVGTDLEPVPGSRQSLEFGGVPSGQTIYVAVCTFTEDDNLSKPSNIASVRVP